MSWIADLMSWLAKVLKWETMPSTDHETVPTTPIIPPNLPPDSVLPPETANSPLLWDTPKQAFNSTRMLCDELGMTVAQKNELCATIFGESEFNAKIISEPNENGTRDFGLCQFNNGTLKGIPLWIGEGVTFKDTDEVLNNPEKCVRVMIKTCLAGYWNWWIAHKNGRYQQFLPKTSRMWKLKMV